MVDGHRECESLTALRAGDTHGVHAHDDPVAIDERTAAISGVDRRVGLNQADGAGVSDCADDAAGDGVREDTKREADGDDFLAGSGALRRSEA